MDTESTGSDAAENLDALVLASPKGNYTQFPSGAVDLTKYTSAGAAEVASMNAYANSEEAAQHSRSLNVARQEMIRLQTRDAFFAALPLDGLVALAGYSANDFSSLNKALRNAAPDPAKRTALVPYEGYIKQASGALPALPTTTKVLWRGMRRDNCDAMCSKALVDSYPVGKTVYEPSFFSTSSRPETACVFGRHEPGAVSALYEVDPTPAAHALGKISRSPHESEYLLAPGTKFVVVSVERDVPTPCAQFRGITDPAAREAYARAHPIHLIHLRVVP